MAAYLSPANLCYAQQNLKFKKKGYLVLLPVKTFLCFVCSVASQARKVSGAIRLR